MRHRLSFIPLALIGCDPPSPPPAPPPAPPAHVETIANETELLRLTLTPEAERRLGLVTVRVSGGTAVATRQVAGEVVVPPTSANGIPIGSLSNLRSIGAQQVAADAELARARAQARLARIALERAEALVREEAGSVRAHDEATAALAAAEAALAAARQQRLLLGPSIATLGSQKTLWVRASVFASELAMLRREADAIVRPLGEGGASRSARPIDAPPSANTLTGTVDLYFALANEDLALRVGQRVAVDLPLAARTEGLLVPSAALLRDIHGGEWVYRKTAPGSFVRQRVEVASEVDGRALLARGLAPDVEIVTEGAAELFGTEFGAAH